jgi:hypothetical protein
MASSQLSFWLDHIFSHGEESWNFLDSWNFLNERGWSKVYYSWKCQWTQKHYATFSWQSLWDLVFYRYAPIFFIVACDILVIMYFLVISIQRPLFIFACWFIVMMMRMNINHYYLKNTFPFCDCCFHIVFESMTSLVCFMFSFLHIYEW